jgi:uncharacterized membrane protein
MTDEKSTPAAETDDTVVIVAQVADDQGVLAEGAVAVQGNHVLLVARFADSTAAAAVYSDLQEGEIAGSYHIDGVLVVNADSAGKITIQKLTDHHTKRGLKWGIVAGVVAGIVFPPSILASAAWLGGAGLVVGKIGNVREKAKVEKAVADVITPGTSGILALIDVQDVPAVKEAIPQAQEVKTIPVDEATADAIEKAAGPDAPATA